MATDGVGTEPVPDLLSAPPSAAVTQRSLSLERGEKGPGPAGKGKGLGFSQATLLAGAGKTNVLGKGGKNGKPSGLALNVEKSASLKAFAAPEASRRHQVTYAQLASAFKELAEAAEQKKAVQQLAKGIFPKLAVYNSVDPSLAPYFVKVLERFGDATVLRYAYYYLGRILVESGPFDFWPGGGVPTPNWDAIAQLSSSGVPAAPRREALPPAVQRLLKEASTAELPVHGRRVAALKALMCVPSSAVDDATFTSIVLLIFDILDKATEGSKQRRKRSLFGRGAQNREAAVQGNLHYTALSALRRLPLDPTNDTLIERAVLGIGCSDPVGVRHALAMAAEIAQTNPAAVAVSLFKLAGGSLANAMKCSDLFARVYLARLAGLLVHSSLLYERSDLRGLFCAILFQLLYDSSSKVVLEAIFNIAGKLSIDSSEDQRADGWQILTTSVTEDRSPVPKDKAGKASEALPHRPSELVLKVVVSRLDAMLGGASRPVLHGALRAVTELGKARAAGFNLGLNSDDLEAPSDDALDFAQAMGKVAPAKKPETVDQLLGALMEGVRAVAACECVYVRAQALKALIWMQTEYASADELKATLAGELADPAWTASTINDLLLTLHARFRAAPGMAVVVLELATLFVNRVPAKVDPATLQALWKMCLVGCGPEGKHLALEAVSGLVDLPPPAPPSRAAAPLEHAPASDPRSAVSLQRIIMAAIAFLGENANYAAAEYAWESATPPGAALMMLDSERMVAASGIRNPTLGAALGRLQRFVMTGSWEEKMSAVHALITIAIRSGEPYRLQIYEFFHGLIYGGAPRDKVRLMKGSAGGEADGEDRGASGTGLAVVIQPMLRVLDEMYQAQEHMMREIRNHDFNKEEWKDEQLKGLYDEHKRLMDIASLFCFIPRAKYLPLGPVSGKLINMYRYKHSIPANEPPDPRLQEQLDKLLAYEGVRRQRADFLPLTLLEPVSDQPAPSTAGAEAEQAEALDGGFVASAINFDNIWAASLVETNEDTESAVSSGSASPTSSAAGAAFAENQRNWDEQSFGGSLREPQQAESPTQTNRGVGSRRDAENEAFKSVASTFSNDTSASVYESVDYEPPADRSGLPVGKALYEFFAGDEDELSLAVGDELEVEYEVDGWCHVRKKNPGPGAQSSGLVPVMYVQIS